MKNRSTLILLFVAVVAIGYFFVIEQPRHDKRTASNAEAMLLTTVVPDDVAQLVIERPGVMLDFARAQNGWTMQRPARDVAEAASVNVLLHSITGARVERRFESEDARLADFGLAAPEAVVLLLDRSGKTLVHLDVGSLTMTREYAYAHVAGSGEVLLVPTGIRRYALREIDEFRSKVVANFDVDQVTALTLQTPRQAMRWWKADDGRWLTQQDGDTIRGDNEEITNAMKRVLTIRAGSFVDNSADSVRYFQDPVGVMTIELGKETHRLTFAAGDSERCYVSTTTTSRVARVDDAVLDVFTLKIEDLRNRRVLSFTESAVARISLDTTDVTLSIVKHGPEWTFTNPAFGDLDQAAVRVLLKELENMMFREIVQERLRDPAAWGLDPAPYHLQLFDAEDHKIDDILAGSAQAEGGIRYATSGAHCLGILDTEPLDEIEALFKDFRTP